VKKLPEPIANEIMKYLNGKELLSAMEVSKYWNDFIKVRSGLMDKVIFKPKNVICTNPESTLMIDNVYSEENKRHYKHIKTPVSLRKYSFIYPIALHASTIETLEITEEWHDLYDWDKIDPEVPSCTFVKLKKLIFSAEDWPKFLYNSKFPVLTHLKITSPSHYISITKFLESLPKLEVLSVDFTLDFDENWSPPNQLRIKAIHSLDYARSVKKLGLHLEKLEIESQYFDAHNLKKLLKDRIVLKSLTLHNLKLNGSFNADKELARNESIEILKIINIWSLSSAWPKFKRFLLAMPSLKELVLYSNVTNDLLQFLGEDFFCKIISLYFFLNFSCQHASLEEVYMPSHL
jgi:hypothetical protein